MITVHIIWLNIHHYHSIHCCSFGSLWCRTGAMEVVCPANPRTVYPSTLIVHYVSWLCFYWFNTFVHYWMTESSIFWVCWQNPVVYGHWNDTSLTLACEQQTHFQLSLLSLRWPEMHLLFTGYFDIDFKFSSYQQLHYWKWSMLLDLNRKDILQESSI